MEDPDAFEKIEKGILGISSADVNLRNWLLFIRDESYIIAQALTDEPPFHFIYGTLILVYYK